MVTTYVLANFSHAKTAARDTKNSMYLWHDYMY